MSSQYQSHAVIPPFSGELASYIDLGILEALLQIVVDSFIGDLTYEGKIRHSNLFLLRRLKNCLPHLRLSPIAGSRLRARRVLFPASSLGDSLH